MKNINKNELLKQRKLNNNSLPRYDLAIKPASTNAGYLLGDQVNTSSFTSTSGQDLSPLASAARKATVQNALTRGIGYGTSIAGMLGTAATASANAAKIGGDVMNMIGSGLIEAGTSATTTGTTAATSAAATGASAGSAASSAASGALSPLGYVTGGLGAAYGLYDMGSNWFTDTTLSEGEMLKSSGKATLSAEGVDYDIYTGVNEAAIRDYQNAMNTGSTVNSAISGAGAGGTIGLMAGGPLGLLLGGLGGGLVGLIGGLFGGESRKEEAERKLRNLRTMVDASNLQNESVAASTGLRNKYNAKHGETTGVYNADKGMDAYSSTKEMFNKNKSSNKNPRPGESMFVWTEDGPKPGKVHSMVGQGESIINYNVGKASLVTAGKKRHDTIPSSAQEGDDTTIAGNDTVKPMDDEDLQWLLTDPNTDLKIGESFANLIAPYTKMVEYANNILDNINKKGSPATLELQRSQAEKMKLYALNKMKPITDRQQLLHEYEAALQDGLYRADKGMDARGFGKLSKYNDAKKNLNIFEKESMNFLPYAMMAAPIIEQGMYYRGNRPYAENPYVGNTTARLALTTLGRLRADNYNLLAQAADSNRQNLYTINNLAGITPGQRLAMINANNSNYAKLRASIAANANEENNKYKQAYASALLSEGREEAKERMRANVIQLQNYRDAVAKWRKGIETYGVNRNNLIASALQNRFKNLMSGRTLDMYQLELDRKERELALAYEERNAHNNTSLQKFVPTVIFDRDKYRVNLPSLPIFNFPIVKQFGSNRLS